MTDRANSVRNVFRDRGIKVGNLSQTLTLLTEKERRQIAKEMPDDMSVAEYIAALVKDALADD